MTTFAARMTWPRIRVHGLAWVVLAVAAAAWVALALPSAGHTHGQVHHYGSAVTTVGAWTLMVVAMMLPPALPLLTVLHALMRRQRAPLALVGWGAAVFVAVWTGVGAILLSTAELAAVLVNRVPWLDAHPGAVAGSALILAGAYQFTPVKDACLTACRSPRSFAVAHWRGARPPAVETAALVARYAANCVGCCIALMGLSLITAAAALPVMVLLALVMAAERLLRRGRLLVVPVGLALLAGGITTVTTSVLFA